MIHYDRWPRYGVALYTLTHKEVTRFFRIWSQTLVPSRVSMALYFAVFGKLIGPKIGEMGGQSYINYIVPGLIMMSVITNAYTNVVSSFFGSKFQRNMEEMLVAPMPSVLIIWGYLIGGVLRGLIVGLLVFIVAYAFTELRIQHWGITFSIALLTALLFSLAGLLNGLFARKFDDINIVPTFVLAPLTYLGGVFYAIHVLPPFWQKLTHLNPIFYVVNAFRYGISGYSDVSLPLAFGVIFAFILFFYALVWICFERRSDGLFF
jgi:ABC-2 type transport system permease protein